MLLHFDHYIHWLVLLSLVAGLRGQLRPKLLLAGQSYKLNYRVKHDSAAYEVEELHSVWQGRSKMHYKQHGRGDAPPSNTFYSDGKHVLEMGLDATSCHQVPLRSVDQVLYNFPDNLLEDFGDNHLIGAGKLLSFIETNLAKFSQVDADLKDAVADIEFHAQFKPGPQVISVSLSYNKDQSQNLAHGIPKSIMVTLDSSKKLVVFEFTRYQTLNNRFQSSMSSVASANQYADFETNSATSYDLFFVDRAIGCSKVLDFEKFAGKSIELVEHDSKRFSFTSRPPATNGGKLLDMSAIYEPSLSTLRIDRQFDDVSIHTIVNFKADRKFHFAEKRNDDKLASNPITKIKRERSCVVSRVNHLYNSNTNSSGSPFTLGQMLLGIEHLVYLGLARVRGIEAKVYEAHDCDWPVWLQQPLVYEQWDELQLGKGDGLLNGHYTLKWHDDPMLMSKQRISMTNVFYFADTGQEFDFLESKLLLVEIFLRDEKRGKIIKRSTFPIYDFSWDLMKTNPVGQKYENSFSLQDHCLASSEESYFASIKILFGARANSDKLDWLKDSTKRNLAILRIAQTKLSFTPVSMIYDIESQLTIGNQVANPNRPEPDREISIAVHMRAAERTKLFARTLFICMADPSWQLFESSKTNNFQSCHNLAAHRLLDTFIAFNVRTSECLIMKDDVARERDLSKIIGQICKFGQTTGNFVVYQILHHDNWEGGFRYLQEGIDWLRVRDDIAVLNPMEIHKPESAVKFRLKSYDSSKLNDKLKYDSDPKHLSSDKKFSGFGLISTEPQNKLFDLHSNHDDHQLGAMKFEDCQTACLADFECQSFSVCATGGKMNCVLSTISFSRPSMVLQMTKLAEAKNKFGEKSVIRIDLEEQKNLTRRSEAASHGEFISVLRHPTCELHNKLYRDYFDQQSAWVKFGPANVVYRPVAHMDQCAELCFKKTVDFLREMSQLEKRYGSHVEKNHEAMQMKRACGAYYYISKQQLESEVSEALDKHLVENGHQEFVDGFCVLYSVENVPGENVAHIEHEALRELTFGTYHFDYRLLYTKESGVSLADSKLTYGERKQLISGIKEAISKGLSHKETNENLGRVEGCNHNFASACVRECAEECFKSESRESSLKCRSFDYIEIDHIDRETRRICAMNSVTLKSTVEAKRMDLINRGSNINRGLYVDPLDMVKVWHYEPREGIVAESQKFELINSFDWVSSTGVHLGGFGLFLVVVVLFSVGIIAGAFGGSKFLFKRQTEEVDGLVVNPGYESGSPGIDMNNIVDFK